MSNVSLHQFLVLYTWFPLAALLLFMLLIARFYQKFSGEETYFRLYAVAVIIFGIVAVRYASAGVTLGEWLIDFFSALGGILLLFLSYILDRRMLTQPENNE